MNHLLNKTVLGTLGAVFLGNSAALAAETSKFEQDRAAILGMAGAFKVTFSFKEVLAFEAGYELKKDYVESAKELVKVVKDDGKVIVLQHLLVVGSEEEPEVVKHWGQVWRFEDRHVFDFQKKGEWTAREAEKYGAFCITRLVQADRPGAQLVFVSARQAAGGQNASTPGNFYVRSPFLKGRRWATEFSEKDSSLKWGNVDMRYHKRAVGVFLDGSARVLNSTEVQDMRIWAKGARAADDAKWTIETF